MDPVTHGLVGAAISAFSGQAVALNNPFTIGATLGAMAPDLDFVVKIIKGDAAYLEHHRGASHSVPYLLGFSVAIATLLSFLPFDNFMWGQTLFWTFLGAISHTLLDSLNSYGAKLFKKKIKANLLTLYDPVITLVGLYLILNRSNGAGDYVMSVAIVSFYFFVRWYVKKKSYERILAYLSTNYDQVSLSLMPSLKHFYKWDFVAHTLTHDLVGSYTPFHRKGNVYKKMKFTSKFRKTDPLYTQIFNSSLLGNKFSTFSPNLHVKKLEQSEDEKIVLRVLDLRYHFKEEFLHQATMVLDKNYNVLSAHWHPYSLKKAIPV